VNPRDYYRCHCGLSLFATAETASRWAWARHLAHIEAFQAESADDYQDGKD
jgi:hypothetical protein